MALVSKSGVYFFGSPDGEIIYIGKATKNNLHHRVWDHVRTPQVELDGRLGLVSALIHLSKRLVSSEVMPFWGW